MLRGREDYSELQLLKQQVKELSDEVKSLKISLKSEVSKSHSDNIAGRNLGKMLGDVMLKSKNSSDYNQQLLTQFYKLASNSFNVPSSFANPR